MVSLHQKNDDQQEEDNHVAQLDCDPDKMTKGNINTPGSQPDRAKPRADQPANRKKQKDGHESSRRVCKTRVSLLLQKRQLKNHSLSAIGKFQVKCIACKRVFPVQTLSQHYTEHVKGDRHIQKLEKWKADQRSRSERRDHL